VVANNIAKWDGSNWSGSAVECSRPVEALRLRRRSGPRLRGRKVQHRGGVPAKTCAKWNAAELVGAGQWLNSHVPCLTMFDDGSGPALYAGGSFTTAGGGRQTGSRSGMA
jgi:hypothetical protein